MGVEASNAWRLSIFVTHRRLRSTAVCPMSGRDIDATPIKRMPRPGSSAVGCRGWEETMMMEPAKRPNLHSTDCWCGHKRDEHDKRGCQKCNCDIFDTFADMMAGVARMALERGLRLDINGEPGEELYRLTPRVIPMSSRQGIEPIGVSPRRTAVWVAAGTSSVQSLDKGRRRARWCTAMCFGL